jgi:hypothetical protein
MIVRDKMSDKPKPLTQKGKNALLDNNPHVYLLL